jgi:hypothetical protein
MVFLSPNVRIFFMTLHIIFLVAPLGIEKRALNPHLKSIFEEEWNFLIVPDDQRDNMRKNFQKNRADYILDAYEHYSHSKDARPFIAMIPINVKEHRSAENNYRKLLKKAGIPKEEIKFFFPIVLKPDLKHSDEEVREILMERHATHYDKVATKDAWAEVSAAQRLQEDVIPVNIDLKGNFEKNETHLTGLLKAHIRDEIVAVKYRKDLSPLEVFLVIILEFVIILQFWR